MPTGAYRKLFITSKENLVIDRLTIDLLALFAIISVIRNWYKRTSRYHGKAVHRPNMERDNAMNKWVGEISDEMHKRLLAKFRGERIYSLYVGAYHRGSMA